MFFSGSWLLSGDLAAAILMVGVLAGVIYGLWSIHVHSKGASRPLAMDVPQVHTAPEIVSLPTDTTSDSTPEQVSDKEHGREGSPLYMLGWFVLGLLGELWLSTRIDAMANPFRGPAIRAGMMGGTIHENDDSIVFIGLLCLSIWATACLAALTLRKLGAPRALVWGILVAAAPLGYLLAIP
jgi:hypothetical protein